MPRAQTALPSTSQAPRCPARTSLFELPFTSERLLSPTLQLLIAQRIATSLGSVLAFFLGLSLFSFQMDFSKNLLVFHPLFQILKFWLNRVGKGNLVAS